MARKRRHVHRDEAKHKNEPRMAEGTARQTLSEWEIIRTIGSGTHGTVYEVANRNLPNQRAALKILKQLIHDPSTQQRFEQEARAARLAHHPNVVELYDYGVAPDGRSYLLMELLEGMRLDQLERRLPLRRLLSVGADIAAALSVAHQSKVIHRDVKPQNILLCGHELETAHVKLLDFGVAKILDPDQTATKTSTGEWIGTPAYMSPEQWNHVAEIDERVDIYALGITLYELLVGQPPFSGKTHYDVQQAHLTQNLPQPELFTKLPTKLQSLLKAMMAKDREQRPRTMSAVAVELRRLCDALDAPKPNRRHAASSASVGLLVLLLFSLTTNDRHEGILTASWNSLRVLHTGLIPTSLPQVNTKQEHSFNAWNESLPPAIQSTSVPTSLANDAIHLPISTIEDPPISEPSDQPSSWYPIWPGFTNGRETSPHNGLQRSGGHTNNGFRMQLFWRIPPPRQPASIRISKGTDRFIPDDANLVGAADDGWFKYEADTLTFDPKTMAALEGALLFEVRDASGCLLATGLLPVEWDPNISSQYVSLDTPTTPEFKQLRVHRRQLSDGTSIEPGVLRVFDQHSNTLIDCGPRCTCWVPQGTDLHFVGIGGQRAPFAGWSIPSCESNPRCKLHEADLRADLSQNISGAFLAWQPTDDGWETLMPRVVTLTEAQKRYYHDRRFAGNTLEFANPSQLRAVASSRPGSFWIAGRGGLLIGWDESARGFAQYQVGRKDDAAPIPENEFGRVIGRHTDFYSTTQQRDGIAYAAGHIEYGSWAVRPTIFRYDGQQWSEVQLDLDTAAAAGKHLGTLVSIWASPRGDRVMADGQYGGIWDRDLGILSNPDPKLQHLWSVTGNDRGSFLLVGDGAKQAFPTVITLDPGETLRLHNSLKQPDGTDVPNVTLRASWMSPDGRDLWFAGLNDRVFQYRRALNGQLSPTTICPRGAQTHRVLSMWGTDSHNVWVASRNEVLHCDGTNPWTIRHTAPVGVELTGIAGDPTGEIWVVGFYKAPDQNPGPSGRNDFAYIARFRPAKRLGTSEAFDPPHADVGGQSTDQSDRSAN